MSGEPGRRADDHVVDLVGSDVEATAHLDGESSDHARNDLRQTAPPSTNSGTAIAAITVPSTNSISSVCAPKPMPSLSRRLGKPTAGAGLSADAGVGVLFAGVLWYVPPSRSAANGSSSCFLRPNMNQP
jgi:hypothetical protein